MSDAMNYRYTQDEIGQLNAEIDRLKEQISHGMPAIEELTKEREMYRMRWLGSMTPEDATLIRAENGRLRTALEPFVKARGSIEVGDLSGALSVICLADLRRACRAFDGEQASHPEDKR